MAKAPFLTTTDSASLVNLKRAPTPTDRIAFEQASEDVQFITLAFLREQQEIHLPGTTVPMIGYSIAAFALSVPAAVAVASVLSASIVQWVGMIILLAIVAVLLGLRQDGGKTDQARASAIVWYEALMGALPPARVVREGSPVSLCVSTITLPDSCQVAAAQNEDEPEPANGRTPRTPTRSGEETEPAVVPSEGLTAETNPA